MIGPCGSNGMAGGFVMGIISGLRLTQVERGGKSMTIQCPSFEPGEDEYIHICYAWQGSLLR